MNEPALRHLEEEALELAFAIMKWSRGDGSLKAVREEMADVQALLDTIGSVPKARLRMKRKKMESKYEG